jgi:class 3 adenylate cyclase
MLSFSAEASPAAEVAARPGLSAAAVNYRPRLIGCLLFAVMLASIPPDDLFWFRTTLAAIYLLWPHIAYRFAQSRGGDRRVETFNVYTDYVLGALAVPAFELRLWPTAMVFVVAVINGLLWGGPLLLFRVLLLGLPVIAASFLLLGIQPHFDTEPVNLVLSLAALFFYVVTIAYTAYRLAKRGRETREALRLEERKSHELLINMLPESIVPRLKKGDNPIADEFADVTVVFVDVVGFTPLAERLGPKRTVLFLNELFAKFDKAAAALKVEKIETTGDGYLAVAGAPQPLDGHAEAAADFALAALAAARSTKISDTESTSVRIGVHTGPVFGGVIGETRFHYKIFGDTVNTASRLQSQATAGCTLISDTTFKRIQRTHRVREHAVVELKGHGPMRTYWLEPALPK